MFFERFEWIKTVDITDPRLSRLTEANLLNSKARAEPDDHTDDGADHEPVIQQALANSPACGLTSHRRFDTTTITVYRRHDLERERVNREKWVYYGVK